MNVKKRNYWRLTTRIERDKKVQPTSVEQEVAAAILVHWLMLDVTMMMKKKNWSYVRPQQMVAASCPFRPFASVCLEAAAL